MSRTASPLTSKPAVPCRAVVDDSVTAGPNASTLAERGQRSEAGVGLATNLRLVAAPMGQEAGPPALVERRSPEQMPYLMTAGEVAAFLRTSRKAVYAMKERGRLPVVNVGRRVLFRRDGVIALLEHGSAQSAEKAGR